MKPPSHIASVEWMRDAFRALDQIISSDQRALPAEWHNVIHSPPTDIRGLQQWILRICDISKSKPSQLASVAGLSPSTLNRFLSKSNTTASLNAKTIGLVEEAAVTLAVAALDSSPLDWREGDEAEDDGPGPRGTMKFKHDVMRVPVVGTLGINQEWMIDTFQDSFTEEYPVIVPAIERYKNRYLFAFEILDMREDKIDNPEKDMVICIPTWFDDVKLMGGERVVILERSQLHTISAGIRDLIKDDRGNIWLMPLHKDVGRIEPAFFGREMGQTVKGTTGIGFLILGAFRRFAWAERVA